MAKFIVCSTPSVHYGGQVTYDHVNHPVNIELVTQIRKTVHKSGYDTIGHPAIEFDFIGGGKPAEWHFERRTVDEICQDNSYGSRHGRMVRVQVLVLTERDAEFDRILKEHGAVNAAG